MPRLKGRRRQVAPAAPCDDGRVVRGPVVDHHEVVVRIVSSQLGQHPGEGVGLVEGGNDHRGAHPATVPPTPSG